MKVLCTIRQVNVSLWTSVVDSAGATLRIAAVTVLKAGIFGWGAGAEFDFILYKYSSAHCHRLSTPVTAASESAVGRIAVPVRFRPSALKIESKLFKFVIFFGVHKRYEYYAYVLYTVLWSVVT